MGVVFDVEVVPEDGGYEFRQTRVAGIGGVVEGVLTIAIGLIEADAFRRVAEAPGWTEWTGEDCLESVVEWIRCFNQSRL